MGPVPPFTNTTAVSIGAADDIHRKYPKLFEGVGFLKGFEAEINIDREVKPVAQPVRRIPVGL